MQTSREFINSTEGLAPSEVFVRKQFVQGHISYSACLCLEPGGGISATEGAISLHHAEQVIARIRAEHPTANSIFLRRYTKTGKYQVLHKYTVDQGSTAQERRDKAQRERCQQRGFHDYQEFIDPRSGGFIRCKDCGNEMDCEGGD